MGFTCSQSSWGGTQERWKWTHLHAVPTWCHTRVSLEHSVITAPELQHAVGEIQAHPTAIPRHLHKHIVCPAHLPRPPVGDDSEPGVSDVGRGVPHHDHMGIQQLLLNHSDCRVTM